MIYRKDAHGDEVSQLGYGCMRFTRSGASIDYAKAEAELLKAYELGVNYYDTAYMYPGSEEILGEVLEKNELRSKIKIATKLPQYIVKKSEQIDSIFEEECKRLRTDYIDYYLMHMITDVSDWEKLVALGIKDWISEKKESGQIRNIGFSFHGNSESFSKVLNAYDWDFCQIQYNYLDEYSQAGRKGLEEARALGIPVVIMEPLRGGKLVNIPKDALSLLKDKGWSAPELALKWLWNQEGIMCVLSGMNSLEMVEENTRIAANTEVDCFTDSEYEITAKVREIILSKEKVGCTGCRYCCPCPKGVDIPATFYSYNMMYVDKKNQARVEYLQNVGLQADPGFASKCIECGACEKKCPQGIAIREKLKEADKALRPWPYKVGMFFVRKFLKKNKQ